jgi:hypothetical protein
VAQRLRAGLRLVGAYLRRLLLLLALEIEPTLVVTHQPLKRPHGRKTARRASLVVFPQDDALPEDLFSKPAGPQPRAYADGQQTRQVSLKHLLATLDALAAILADPLPRARRLALHIGRSRPGVILPPATVEHIPNRFGTTISAAYDAMGLSIQQASRNRPPPLPPPRRNWRSVTML